MYRKLLPVVMALIIAAPATAQNLRSALVTPDVMVPSIPFKPASSDEVLANFMQSVLKNKDLKPAQRAAVLGELDKAAKQGMADQAITQALTTLYPDFGKALADLANEEVDAAIKSLEKLSQADDEYLAAHADYYLARAAFMQERYEDAMPMLSKLAGEEQGNLTMHAGEALFYKGICHAFLIERDEAMQALSTFLQQNADAPERLRVGADHMLYELSLLAEGSLWDVQQRMEFSRRHLDLEWSGEPTQEQQKKIISMLDVLIEQAEQRENQGGS